ncbi:Hsp70 family protein, partial [uncultured Ornithinimicrobium sp.]|uniref:Hsp70 family protein n=1 Tax=uncultured Ornithinimicrobium sp. TaxID=259307 RepID=UPI002592FB4C
MVLVLCTDIGHRTVSVRLDDGPEVASASRSLAGAGVVTDAPGTWSLREDAEPVAQLPVGWLERVGDRVPFHTPEGQVRGDEILSAVVREPLRSVLEGLADTPTDEIHVGVVEPTDWSAHRAGVVRRVVREQVVALCQDRHGGPLGWEAVRVHSVPEPEALAHVTAGVEDSVEDAQGRGSGELSSDACGPVLQVDVGASATRARVLVPGEESGDGPLVVDRSVGGDVLDDRVFRHVLDQLPPALLADRGSEESLAELSGLRSACRVARESLSSATETELPVRLTAARSEIRLVRAELEDLLEPDLLRILEVGHRAVEEWTQTRGEATTQGAGQGRLDRIVLIGGVAHMPRLVQLASATWALPVHRPRHPGTARLGGASAVLRARLDRDASTSEAAPAAVTASTQSVHPVDTPSASVLPPAVVAEGTVGGLPPLRLLDGGAGEHSTRSVLGRPRPVNRILGAAAAVVALAGASTAVAFIPGLMEPAGNAAQIASSTGTTTVVPHPLAWSGGVGPAGTALATGADDPSPPGSKDGPEPDDGGAPSTVRLIRSGSTTPSGGGAPGGEVGRSVALHERGPTASPGTAADRAARSVSSEDGSSATSTRSRTDTEPAMSGSSSVPATTTQPPSSTTQPPATTSDPPPATTQPPA